MSFVRIPEKLCQLCRSLLLTAHLPALLLLLLSHCSPLSPPATCGLATWAPAPRAQCSRPSLRGGQLCLLARCGCQLPAAAAAAATAGLRSISTCLPHSRGRHARVCAFRHPTASLPSLLISPLPPALLHPPPCFPPCRFGTVDDVVTFPGRMYAFVNFRSTEEAVTAFETLQDQQVADLTGGSGRRLQACRLES